MDNTQNSSQPVSPETLLAFMRSRRSIRRFEPRPLDPAWIDQLLEAACWAPSAHNRQPWRWVTILSEEAKRSLANAMAERLADDLRADGVDEQTIAKDTARSRQRLTDAPVLILACLSMAGMDHYPDARRQALERVMALQSLAMAAQNLLLMAHALGLGACWLCAPLFCPEIPVKTLNLPPDYEPQGVIAIGFPAEARQKDREPLESRVIRR